MLQYIRNQEEMQTMPMTPPQMIKFLKEHGFEEISQKGSHLKMRNPKTGRWTVVPKHAKDIPAGTEQATLRQAVLKK